VTTPFDQPSTLAGSNDPEGGDGAYSFDGKPDRWKRYRLPHPESGKPGGFTRATTFAKSISDTYSLNMWALRMGGKGLAMRPDLLARVASTSLDEREALNRLMEDAKDAAGSKVGANLGTALHAFSEAVDRGEEPNIPPPYQPHLRAYTALLEKFNLEILDIERVVLCTEYDNPVGVDGKPTKKDAGVAGTLDRIVRFTKDTTVNLPGGKTYTFKKGTIAILDLKSAKSLEYGGLEIAVQLATYARAKVRFDKQTKKWLPMPEPMDTNVALVVHLPATAPGETVKAEMFAVDIAAGHEIAQLCTEVREARKRKNLLVPLAVIEEPGITAGQDDGRRDAGGPNPIKVASERVADIRPPTLEERVASARTEAELTAMRSRPGRTRLTSGTSSSAAGRRCSRTRRPGDGAPVRSAINA
jgi:hypothetical protein